MDKKQVNRASQEKLQGRPSHSVAPRERLRNAQLVLESDKDSGYSDVASECLSSVEQTDSEEVPNTSSQNVAETPSGSQQSHQTPLVILKNLLIDQGSSPDPPVSSWAVRPPFQLFPTSPQILLFPPTVSPAKPQTSSRNDAKYLPILNSYTKIAPHPSRHFSSSSLPHRGKRSADEKHHSQVKRPCSKAPSSGQTETESSVIPETSIQDGLLNREEATTSGLPKCKEQDQVVPPESSGSVDENSNAASIQYTAHSMPTAEPVMSEHQNKSRRFQNTLDVLHRSGLLGIAMKTKELSRLNQATQCQLEKLKEQVQLYVKAMGTNQLQDWQRLQDSLVGSGHGNMGDQTVSESVK
ncbi:CLOCK-interacting pacemaker [Rhinophrynus dorsalis]